MKKHYHYPKLDLRRGLFRLSFFVFAGFFIWGAIVMGPQYSMHSLYISYDDELKLENELQPYCLRARDGKIFRVYTELFGERKGKVCVDTRNEFIKSILEKACDDWNEDFSGGWVVMNYSYGAWSKLFRGAGHNDGYSIIPGMKLRLFIALRTGVLFGLFGWISSAMIAIFLPFFLKLLRLSFLFFCIYLRWTYQGFLTDRINLDKTSEEKKEC